MCFHLFAHRFKIRDLETGSVLFEICKQIPADATNQNQATNENNDEKKDKSEGSVEEEKDSSVGVESPTNSGRFVRYQFTKEFLKLKTVGALWVSSEFM